MVVYSGYITKKEKLLQSASGGFATVLSESIIKRGGCVFGVGYTEDFYDAKYYCVEDLNQLSLLKGSKYLSASKDGVYRQLEDKLAEGKEVLFIGLGCDVGAIKAYCMKKNLNTDNLYLIDILCHGPAPKEVHKAFIRELEKKYVAKVVYYNIRYKKRGWDPFYVRVLFDNGKIYEEKFDETDFGKAFYTIAKPACTKCIFKGEKHMGDLCIGDFWGKTEGDKGWNYNGVSLIIKQTEKGSVLLDFLGDDFVIMKDDEELAIMGNPMYIESRKQNTDYKLFMRNLNEHGLHYAVKKIDNNIANRFIRFIKNTILKGKTVKK